MKPPHELERKKSGDVAAVALKIKKAIPCPVCAVGIAIDIVDRHWSGAGHDWRGEAFGHGCRLATSGLTATEIRDVEAVEAEYTGKESAA